ncbi:MAG: hypothetical protein GY754_29540 [bacterium]|nr:hypothetical protein [bacterium]
MKKILIIALTTLTFLSASGIEASCSCAHANEGAVLKQHHCMQGHQDTAAENSRIKKCQCHHETQNEPLLIEPVFFRFIAGNLFKAFSPVLHLQVQKDPNFHNLSSYYRNHYKIISHYTVNLHIRKESLLI